MDADERDLRESTAAVERLRDQWIGWIDTLDAAATGPVPETALQVARQILRKVLYMVIHVVPEGRGVWNFYGAAAVDAQVQGRVNRNAAVAIFNLPGGGLRYMLAPISGGSDAEWGLVRAEEMAPHAPQYSRHAIRSRALTRASARPGESPTRSPVARYTTGSRQSVTRGEAS